MYADYLALGEDLKKGLANEKEIFDVCDRIKECESLDCMLHEITKIQIAKNIILPAVHKDVNMEEARLSIVNALLTKNQFLPVKEIEKKYMIEGSSIRHKIRRGRFLENEYYKTGTAWYISTQAIEREYAKFFASESYQKKRKGGSNEPPL